MYFVFPPFPVLSFGFTARPFFADIAHSLPRKSSFSGLANSSAKLALVAYLLESAHKDSQNILFLSHENAEIEEMYGLAGMFFDTEKYNIHILQKENTHERVKIECVIALAQSQKNKKNIFFLPESSAVAEMFPRLERLAKQQLTLQKEDSCDPMDFFGQLVRIGYDVSLDSSLHKGQYRRQGDIIDVFPVGSEHPFKIEIEFGTIKNIWAFSPQDKKVLKSYTKIIIFPAKLPQGGQPLYELISDTGSIIADDIDDLPNDFLEMTPAKTIRFTPFPEGETDSHIQMRFLSVLKFYTLSDLLSDFRSKLRQEYLIFVLTKRKEEIQNILTEENISFHADDISDIDTTASGLFLIDAGEAEHIPPGFQNPDQKVLFITDREIFQLRKNRKQKSLAKLNLEFLTSLKIGDYVVHMDHGIGHFLGVSEQEIDGHIKEYLELAYSGSDRLFVPVDQADKVSRFMCEEGSQPKLHRLGSQEWENTQRKAKKETEKIAKDLLKLYAEREQVQKKKFLPDTPDDRAFADGFPYEETPGQLSAIHDIKKDMESTKPMDRLVCGDVGFGKTEVALRAAFKCVQSGRQVAVVAPVTILAKQHYESFMKRMAEFGIRIETLSRFRTPTQQKETLNRLKKGRVDIVIGTHRLLQKDIIFHNLGLLIVDEEQRFGVKQKEKLKELRKNVDILTLTATPIPRTLNLALNKLRDISTITTPPPGRLPISTEVRKYSDHLVRDAITKELERGGQVYFLHNRVQTIESVADKLRMLVPEAKIVVGHGQLAPADLEQRILDFKEKKYNILVSSTIVENGIDLPNANTIIVMNAERFGLSQLYQLRGRIGRGKRQAYAYFLYQTQKLSIEAKKRLRAIVEASELGSGFQIAMRDLEIRGAGDVLGVSQAGTVNTVGVGHFLRMLNQTIKSMKEGRTNKEEEEESLSITVELPVDAFIPSGYISDAKEKILAYQNIASATTLGELQEITKDFQEEYGKIPQEVSMLLKIIELKIFAREAGISAIRSLPLSKTDREIQLILTKKVSAAQIMNLLKHQEKWLVSADRLKIPLSAMGQNFVGEIQKALGFLGNGKQEKKIQKQ